MSIESIHVLSMNPHFMARLIQAFLGGYGEACSIQIVSLSLPILYHNQAKEKLLTAKNTSRLETLYTGKVLLNSGESISARTKVAGFEERYRILLPYVKQAIIVGCNENLIMLNKDLQLCPLKILNHKDVSLKKSVSQLIRSAYYLGTVFRKATPEQLSHILEVNLT